MNNQPSNPQRNSRISLLLLLVWLVAACGTVPGAAVPPTATLAPATAPPTMVPTSTPAPTVTAAPAATPTYHPRRLPAP
ncbi:MAG: hypothetical protein HC876_05790, partial [Chloroflexaceae bacterium]|nr:hypothetical protein [Chloroflexaceae bacterium]